MDHYRQHRKLLREINKLEVPRFFLDNHRGERVVLKPLLFVPLLQNPDLFTIGTDRKLNFSGTPHVVCSDFKLGNFFFHFFGIVKQPKDLNHSDHLLLQVFNLIIHKTLYLLHSLKHLQRLICIFYESHYSFIIKELMVFVWLFFSSPE